MLLVPRQTHGAAKGLESVGLLGTSDGRVLDALKTTQQHIRHQLSLSSDLFYIQLMGEKDIYPLTMVERWCEQDTTLLTTACQDSVLPLGYTRTI
jgi:hypothetical protein